MRYLCFRLLEMKLCDEQIRISSTGSSVWVSHNNNNNKHSQGQAGPSQERLVASYVQLYSQARLDTLDALDKLVELRQAEELKSKLLFSIIVVSTLTYTHILSHSHSLTTNDILSQLSFRSVTKTLAELRNKVYSVLQVTNS